ncbi:imidazole glycerol phosphate synthase subunit HisH [Dongia mobilis]|jgi:glutamine amidotransferase|uniref:imidazole glycerol phosphate synthase subunit HisH n=1 Tax=Dongia sp. TaxID=1977262 RepID=UPI0026EC5722
MPGVVIVNSGVCNLDSIQRAVEECGGKPEVTDDPRIVEQADRIILPGVGSFAAAMQAMNEKGIAAGLRNLLAKRQVPFLGICLGMQLMATRSYEFGLTDGLDFIPGEIVPLKSTQAGERIPHMGWNETHPKPGAQLWRNLPDGADFYFVHSYHYDCAESDVLAVCPSYGGFAAAVQRDNLMGVQFHPEKSQKAGFELLRNFLAI